MSCMGVVTQSYVWFVTIWWLSHIISGNTVICYLVTQSCDVLWLSHALFGDTVIYEVRDYLVTQPYHIWWYSHRLLGDSVMWCFVTQSCTIWWHCHIWGSWQFSDSVIYEVRDYLVTHSHTIWRLSHVFVTMWWPSHMWGSKFFGDPVIYFLVIQSYVIWMILIHIRGSRLFGDSVIYYLVYHSCVRDYLVTQSYVGVESFWLLSHILFGDTVICYLYDTHPYVGFETIWWLSHLIFGDSVMSSWLFGDSVILMTCCSLYHIWGSWLLRVQILSDLQEKITRRSLSANELWIIEVFCGNGL